MGNRSLSSWVEVRRGDLRLENLGESVEMLDVDSRVVELFLGQDVGAPGFLVDVLRDLDTHSPVENGLQIVFDLFGGYQ
jgi:hypothetical protein